MTSALVARRVLPTLRSCRYVGRLRRAVGKDVVPLIAGDVSEHDVGGSILLIDWQFTEFVVREELPSC